MTRAFFFCGAFLFWGGVWGASVSDKVLVRFSERVAVVGPRVSLGEISEISGANRVWVEKLRRLDLVKAPPAGRTFLVSRGLIKRSLLKEGYPLENLLLEGPEEVLVETKSQAFLIDSLLPQLREFVITGLQEAPEHVEVKLSNPGKELLLPGGKVRANIRPPLSGRYEGLLLLTIELEVDGRSVRVLPVRLEVEVSRSVLVTKVKVEKGMKFDPGKVELVRRPASRIPPGYLDDLESVIGRTASMSLPPGAILRVQSLYDPPAIRQGQMVRATVIKGNVEISVDVKAVDSGKVGETIRVENTSTKKVFKARILSEKLVSVDERQK